MSEVKTMNNKQAYDYIKRLSGNTNDRIEEFNDYVKSVKIGAGCGNTILRIFTKLLDKNEVYYEMAYDAGKKEIATLVMKLAKEGLFREIDLIEENKRIQTQLEKAEKILIREQSRQDRMESGVITNAMAMIQFKVDVEEYFQDKEQ